MDSRLHSQRQRGRLRVSRGFTPPQQHQFVQQQQLPPAASSHFHPQQHHVSPLHHRLSLVDDHFPRATSSGAGIPLEHCDYASLLAYRQRINGLFSTHPAEMVSHLVRSQNALWPQAQRPQGFRATENRLALSDEYNRQGPFERDYRDTRDDLRSLSELDSSRRSAALSAKLFLDEVRPAFQRGTPFESTQALELSRHRIDREEAMSHNSLFSKGSERLGERGHRKRDREEETMIDSRERSLRQRRFHDPGLAALARTPESSRDFPVVQRTLTSGRYVDGEDRQDCHTLSSRAATPRERQELIYKSPSKSVKKKLLAQHRETSSGMHHDNANILKRIDESKDKFTSPNDAIEAHRQIRNLNGQQGGRDSKRSSPSPKASSFFKTNMQSRVDVTNQMNKPDNIGIFNVHKESSVTRATRPGIPDNEQEAGERNPKQRLAARSLSSIRKALKAVESTPRSKNVKTRVIRLLGSDAKVCGVSPKIRQGEQEGNKDSSLELQTTKGAASCKETMQLDTGLSQQKRIQETHCGVKVKQEQLVLAEKSTSLQVATTTELLVPSPMQCQSFADCRSMNSKDNDVSQRGYEKQQVLMSSEDVLPQSSQKERGSSCWLVASENSFDLIADKTGIADQSSVLPVHEWAVTDQDSMHSLLSLRINIGADSVERGNVEDHHSAMLCGSSSLDSLLGRKASGSPFIESSKEVLVLDTEETTAECEVRLFGKSLKAPVAKVRLGSLQQLSPCNLPVSSMPEPSVSLSQVASDQQVISMVHCGNVMETEIDISRDLTVNAASKDGEAEVGWLKKGVDTALISHIYTFSNPAESSLGVVDARQEMPRSPNKLPETLPNVAHISMSEPSGVSSVLASQQEAGSVDNLVEKTFTLPIIVPQSKISAPVLATDQQEDLTGHEAPVNVTQPVLALGMASEQTVVKEVAHTKDLVVQDDQSVAAGEDEGRPEVLFTEKPTSYTPKQVISVHQQGRLQKMQGRAGANTWHRPTNNHGLSSSQIMSKPHINKHLPKVVSQKVSEVAAYVRKGNSLVRAPISSIGGASSSLNPGTAGVGKDLAGKGFSNLSRGSWGYPGFKSVVKNNTLSVFRQAFSVQKVAPQEATPKLASSDRISVAAFTTPQESQDGQSTGSLLTGAKSMIAMTSDGHISNSFSARTTGAEDSTPVLAVSEVGRPPLTAAVQPRPLLSSGQSVAVCSNTADNGTTLYVKSKANQLIAALPVKASQVASSHASPSTQEVYYKRNNNQLVRNGSDAKGKAVEYQTSRSKTHAACRSTSKKVFRKRACLPSSRVWTLKDGSSASQVKNVLPLLFPWKRPGLGLAICAGRYKALPKAKKGSLLFLISKKLQRLRRVQPVYSLSAGGYSLHRSGVLSLSGANLKWTKSIEKRSKQASEEATMAVAAVEKQRRKEKAAVAKVTSSGARTKLQRRLARGACHGRGRVVTIGLARYKMDPLGRTLQRLPDQWCGNAEVNQSNDSAILSTPRRLSYDGTEYVRIGNGHKLIRDPKAATRALANEKVRWSLHTARSRRAKRQQYCLFFTRFGKCNKSEGDCPYIHDPEKIAVCTKFLKGTCSGTNCLFSHKVIPERMPDCSFFLAGMCTNEECPYRHVSVNPKAPICEGFLKGFCSDGDECNKKHTTVCPAFVATGECLDKSVCRLHHPKKNCKRPSYNILWKVKSKRRRRYFGDESNINSGKQTDEASLEGVSSLSFDKGAEFIEIPDAIVDFEDNLEFKRKFAFIQEHIPISKESLHGESDMLIKPMLLLQRPVPV